MRTAATVALFLSLVWVAPLAAQVCYVDADGTKHFVNSKDEVPAPFRDERGCRPSAGSVPNAVQHQTPSAPPATIFGSPGGTAGEPIPLDTPDPSYREYMEKVRPRIYANWGYPLEAQNQGLQGKLEIEFHIAKNGRLESLQVTRSSGEEILDAFAKAAVKLAQPYPPLPDS